MSTIKKLKPEEYSEDRKLAMAELESKNKPLEPIKKEIIKTEPDKKLIADIVKLYAKYYERARIETMMYYWEIGKRLNKEYGNPNPKGNPNFTHVKIGETLKILVNKLRKAGLTIGQTNLSNARRFAIKFPQIKELKQQDMTWNKIVRKLLPEKKKEIELKSDFSNTVIMNFKRWDKFVNEFYNAIPKIDFSKAKKEEKQECIRILKDSIKKLQKRVRELK